MWRKRLVLLSNIGARTRNGSAWSLLLLVASLVAAPSVPAQSTVTLQGRVTSETGQPLQGAQVAVASPETNQTRGTITSPNGSYTIVGLPPGSYEVRVQMLGYGTVRRDIRLVVGQRAVLDFQLAQGAVEVAGLEVTAEREQSFEVQRTDVSTPVIQAEIENLPLNTRNTMNLAAIVPGIKTFAPTAGRSLPAAGSLPELRFWNFYLDGVEWKSMFNGNLVGIPQTGSPIPQEAVREFRVHLNPYDAEFTRGASFIISAVTQRGTNEFEGNGFVYFQNNQLTELDEFQRRSRERNPQNFQRADYERQQLGFNLRGPLVRDRLFFAGSYELNNTANAIQVIPGRPAFNPGVWDRFAGTFSAPTENHTGVLRLTAPMGEQHTLDAIWAGRNYDSETFFGGTAAQEAGINAKYQIHSLQLRDTYTPTASLVNELSFHLLDWDHNESPLRPGPVRIYPSIFFGRSGFPLQLHETHLRAIDRFTYTVPGGRHVINGGVELSRIRTNSFLPSTQAGEFRFATDTSSVPFRATIGMGFFDPESTEDARAVTDGWVTGFFLQDQWQATNNLTLNLGLRYDAEINTLNNDFTVPWASDPVLQSRPELQGFLNRGDRKNDLDNLAPRFSFSWDMFGNQRTFLRGGAGIMYDRIPTFMAFFEKQNAGWRTYEFQNPGTTDPEVLRQRVRQGTGRAVAPNITLMKTDMETPVNYQFSLGAGHEVTENLALNLDYINQHAQNLYVSFSVNPFIASQGRRAITNSYGNITLYDDIGNAAFQALVGTLTYNRRTERDLPVRLSLAYTLGWYESEFEGLGGVLNPTYLSMQPSTADERHRLVLSGLAPLPYGFQLSGVAILATPRPFGVSVGQDVNNTGLFNDDWPNGVRTIRPGSDWENMYRTVDLRLAKDIPVGVGRVGVSAELFNVFNWTNWSSFAGTQQDIRGNPLANFGQPSGVFAPRQAQIGLRYSF